MARNYYQGKYTPKYPQKYMGDPTNCIFRSRWEMLCMQAFDANPNILYWQSEETVIKYFWDGDGKWHRYFVDFMIVVKTKDGSTVKCLVEVKPYAQTIEPVAKKGKRKATLLNEVTTYSKNCAKWAAAREHCRTHGMRFLILTEKDIFPNGKAW